MTDAAVAVRVAALADLHGRLDGVVVPPCDLVVIAGDLSPYAWKQAPNQVPWLEAVFAPWLERIAAEAGAPVVGIAGNRDFAWWWDRRVFEKLPWTYLCDAEATVGGLRVYGSPWCPRRRAKPKARRAAAALAAAAAGRRRAALAAARARRGVHGGRGGRARRALRGHSRGHRRAHHAHAPARARRPDRRSATAWAPTALLAAIERAQPPLAVFGHIHEGRGEPTRAGRTLCANSAICDRWFEPRNQPWLIDIDPSEPLGRASSDVRLVNTH